MAHPRITPGFLLQKLRLKNVLRPNLAHDRALHAKFDAKPDAPFRRVLTDSRKVGSSDLFVAVPGEKFDGHDFVEQAVAQGASAILSEKPCPRALDGKTWYFHVEDVTEAFRALAAAWRATFKIPVICVAGSVGKTTTKELLASLLAGRFRKVVKTLGSQNGFLGIPMTLMELEADTEVAVIEVGIDEIGAMAQHMDLLRPTHTLLTAIGPEHLEKLIDVATVAREELVAFEKTVNAGGKIYVNWDDAEIARGAPALQKAKSKGFSLNADPRAELQGRYDPSRSTLTVAFEGEKFDAETAHFECPLPGEHNARNLLAAVSVAHDLGLNVDELREGLRTFKGVGGRSQLAELPALGVRVLCDYYNANPASVEAAIGLLSGLGAQHGGRKIACLADMLELGTDEEKLHRGLARTVASNRIDHVFLFGERMRALADELKRSGFSAVESFDEKPALAARLKSLLRKGDVVLIKGSRGMRMEEVWQFLQA